MPENPPQMDIEGEPFDYGDILRAKCTSPPAKPPATLSMYLNNLIVRPLATRGANRAFPLIIADKKVECDADQCEPTCTRMERSLGRN